MEVPVAVLRRGSDSWLVSARGRVIRTVDRGSSRTLPRIWLPATTVLQEGAFLADASGALAARSLTALVGSGVSRVEAYLEGFSYEELLDLIDRRLGRAR